MEKDYKGALTSFQHLLEIMDTLRQQCPWDRKQTNLSLKPNTIEEVYELAQAIEDDDTDDIRKELGDLLLHIVFYAKIGEEKGLYDIKSVIDSLCEKLIRRHPHIYGEVKADTADQVRKTWEQIKLTENYEDDYTRRLLIHPAEAHAIEKATSIRSFMMHAETHCMCIRKVIITPNPRPSTN